MLGKGAKSRLAIVLVVLTPVLVAGCTSPQTPNTTVSNDDSDEPDTPPPTPDANAPPAPTSANAPTNDEADNTPSPNTGGVGLRVHMVDVGQGDGVIWELPGGSVVVYDCGPPAASSGENPVARFLRDRLGLQAGATIHALIASHGHLDHIGGCEDILGDYHITHVYEAWYEGDDAPQSYRRFRDRVIAEGATVHTLAPAQLLTNEQTFHQWDLIPLPESAQAAGVRAQIVWPPAFQAATWAGIAKSSIAIRLTLGQIDYCLQGDIELAQEAALASHADERELNCEVYVVGHHGSRHASSAHWLQTMSPAHAIASFGTNPYGHPTAEALCRVQTAGALVYATHRLGNITAQTDGQNLTITPATPETTDYCATGASYWTTAPAPEAQPDELAADPDSTPGTSTSDALTVTATVSSAEPCRYSTVTIHMHVEDADGNPVEGASVTTTWRYKSSAPTEAATTNAQGDAAVSRSIGAATAGYTVTVEITATKDATVGSATTSFTPRTC